MKISHPLSLNDSLSKQPELDRRSSSKIKDKSKCSNQRKLEKRLTFQAKVKDAVINLGAKKAINKKRRSRQRKLRAYDLSALSEFLPDLDVFQQPSTDATKLKLNCKSRQKLVQRESAQLKAVLTNPAFQMNPITAIQCHLERTQPPSVAIKDEGKRRPNRPGSVRRKAKAKKKGAESSMDIQ